MGKGCGNERKVFSARLLPRREAVAVRREGSVAGRRVAPAERHAAQAPRALEAGAAAEQELPAPDRAVGPVAGPVENDADAALQPVFRHHRRRVRKVVLDRDGLPARKAGSDFFRKRRGKIPRVEVARHGLRPDAENPLHPLQPGPVVALHAVVFKVSEILAEVGPVARKQAEAAFQVAAGGQRRPGCGDAQHHRQRHIAPAAPQDLRRSAENAGDGIVQRGADGAGVVQDAAEQRGTDLRHAAVLMDDRFGRGVAAGHDQRAAGVREQAVQARRGEKSAQEAAVAADSGTERLPRLFEQDDGPCG